MKTLRNISLLLGMASSVLAWGGSKHVLPSQQCQELVRVLGTLEAEPLDAAEIQELFRQTSEADTLDPRAADLLRRARAYPQSVLQLSKLSLSPEEIRHHFPFTQTTQAPPKAKPRQNRRAVAIKQASAEAAQRKALTRAHLNFAALQAGLFSLSYLFLQYRFPLVPATHILEQTLPQSLIASAFVHGWLQLTIGSKSAPKQPSIPARTSLQSWCGEWTADDTRHGLALVSVDKPGAGPELFFVELDLDAAEKAEQESNYATPLEYTPRPKNRGASVYSSRPLREKNNSTEEPALDQKVEPLQAPGIQSFEEDAVRRFFDDVQDGVPPEVSARKLGFSWQRYARKTAARLTMLNRATSVHALQQSLGKTQTKFYDRGNAEFSYTFGIEIDKQWRLIFRWSADMPGPVVVGIADFHS